MRRKYLAALVLRERDLPKKARAAFATENTR